MDLFGTFQCQYCCAAHLHRRIAWAAAWHDFHFSGTWHVERALDFTGALRHTLWVCIGCTFMNPLASLDKPASEVMEDASLAMYLWLRRIPGPRQFVLNLGVRHYHVQYPSDDDTAAQIRAQINQELADANLDEIITFFRNMLDQPHREDVFENIYQHIPFHMIIEPRPTTDLHPTLFPQPAQSSAVPVQTQVPQASRTLTAQVEPQADSANLECECPSPAPTLVESSESSGSDATMLYADPENMADPEEYADT